MVNKLSAFGVILAGLGLSGPVAAAPSASEVPVAVASPRAGSAASASESEKTPPTLLGKGTKLTGYGSAELAYTRLFGRASALVGVGGALLLNHQLHLGLAGYAFTRSAEGPLGYFGEEQSYRSGYLGATVKYTFYQQGPVFVTAGALVGGGAIALSSDDNEWNDNYRREDIDRDVDLFAVFQPELAVQANLTRWMRAGLTAGYRLTSGVGRFDYRESDVNGVVLGGGFQFGWF